MNSPVSSAASAPKTKEGFMPPNSNEETLEIASQGATTRRQFMKKGEGATLATLVTWNALGEISKAVDHSSAVEYEYLIKGAPPGNPAGTSYSYVDFPIAGTSAFLRFKFWCSPDDESFTDMSVECAGEVYGYGKIATTGRARLSSSKLATANVFSSKGSTAANPAFANVPVFSAGDYQYAMDVTIVSTRTDTTPTDLKLTITVKVNVHRRKISDGSVVIFTDTQTRSIENYIVAREKEEN